MREDVAAERDLAEERGRDQRAEDEDRGELEQLGHQLAELGEGRLDLGADRGDGDAGREGGQEQVGVGERWRCPSTISPIDSPPSEAYSGVAEV